MRKQRYWLYRRAGIYYLHDAETGKRESLNTHSKREAEQIRIVRNEVAARPQVGWALAKACFAAQDSKVLKRTWQEVIEEFCSRGKSQTQTYRRWVVSQTPFNQLRHKKLIETTADDIMGFLKAGGAQTHLVLRCLHNLAVGLGWLPWPILANKLWPKILTKNKRGITWEEHGRITDAEQNLERRLYYEVLWETGASQTDAALLHAQSIDWRSASSLPKAKN